MDEEKKKRWQQLPEELSKEISELIRTFSIWDAINIIKWAAISFLIIWTPVTISRNSQYCQYTVDEKTNFNVITPYYNPTSQGVRVALNTDTLPQQNQSYPYYIKFFNTNGGMMPGVTLKCEYDTARYWKELTTKLQTG